MRNFGERVVRFCPHFSVDEIAACSSSEGQEYHPSEFQQKEYCTSNIHLLCPFFMTHAPVISVATVPCPTNDR